MLKISQAQPANHAVTLHLEGHVIGAWVAELRNSCEQVLTHGRSLKLDLSDVEFLDADGVALIAALRSRGVALMDCPLFVAEQLKAISGPAV